MVKKTSTKRDQLWLLAAEGQTRRELIAEVAIRVRAHKIYHYGIPPELADTVKPGMLLSVPYGRTGQTREAWCLRLSDRNWDQTYKPLIEIINHETLLNNALLELGLWVGEYYCCPPGQTLDALVPAAMRKPRLRKVRYIKVAGPIPDKKFSAQQRALLAVISDQTLRADEALKAAGVGPSSLNTLRRVGLLEIIEREEPAIPKSSDNMFISKNVAECEEDRFQLNQGQQDALDAINRAADQPADFKVFLLFGVPGSGKTEVYVRAIRQVIAAGQQAIMLVPEIALATQIVERLAKRFPRVVVLHSRLKAGLRQSTLRAIAAGEVDVVIGTRTAVFAPCPRLGLIVADEEQETSFKNLAAPYFHARDVAIKRAQLEQIPVVLGSATPALETWTNANKLAHYELLRLPERVPGAQLPDVKLIEMPRPAPGQAAAILSSALVHRLEETLQTRQQAILLHNRRGYAIYLFCQACGMPVTCRRCGAHMIHHRADNRMKCHRCGASTDIPTQCLDSSCGGELKRTGLGIQRLEQELQRRFPNARLQRLDSDTMKRREDYAAALEAFASGQADILLGTQMVAKGLDFARVGLVGVLEADAGLWLPDFRAAESVFQLIVQVVGRAGRREGDSLALVQAENAALPAIRSAVSMDYETFASNELAMRRQLFDPPASRMIRFICADDKANTARAETEGLAERLRALSAKIHAGIRVDPGQACVVPRLREMSRYHTILRAPREVDPRQLLSRARQEKILAPRVRRFSIDVDPVDLL